MTIPLTVQIAVAPQSGTHPGAVLDPVMPNLERFLAHVDHVFSPFREDSSVCRARRGDWSVLLNDPDFAEVYALCQQAQQYTDGAFNPMHAGVYDPTGLVKGWAIQRAHERFLLPLIRDGLCEAAAFGGGAISRPPSTPAATSPGESACRIRSTGMRRCAQSRCATEPSPHPAPCSAANTSPAAITRWRRQPSWQISLFLRMYGPQPQSASGNPGSGDSSSPSIAAAPMTSRPYWSTGTGISPVFQMHRKPPVDTPDH